MFERIGISEGKNIGESLRKTDAWRIREAELKVQNLSKETRVNMINKSIDDNPE